MNDILNGSNPDDALYAYRAGLIDGMASKRDGLLNLSPELQAEMFLALYPRPHGYIDEAALKDSFVRGYKAGIAYAIPHKGGNIMKDLYSGYNPDDVSFFYQQGVIEGTKDKNRGYAHPALDTLAFIYLKTRLCKYVYREALGNAFIEGYKAGVA